MKRIILSAGLGVVAGLIIMSINYYIANYHLVLSQHTIFIDSIIVLIMGMLALIYLLKSHRAMHHHLVKANEIITKERNEKSNLFYNLFDTSNLGIMIVNLNGEIVEVNQSVCQILNRHENELKQHHYFNLIHES